MWNRVPDVLVLSVCNGIILHVFLVYSIVHVASIIIKQTCKTVTFWETLGCLPNNCSIPKAHLIVDCLPKHGYQLVTNFQLLYLACKIRMYKSVSRHIILNSLTVNYRRHNYSHLQYRHQYYHHHHCNHHHYLEN